MRDRDAAERLRVWLSQRQNWVLGLDCETNALPPQHRDFRVRAVQIADADTAWVLDVESLGTELVAALIRGHRTWVAQFAGVAEVPFLHHGVPGALRLDEDEPHVVELQTLLAWFDPRTLVPAGKDGIDPRLSRPRGLKDNTTRWLTPVLAEVEAEMHAWFHEHAPKGHRTPKKAKAWGFANIPVDSELYQLYSGLDPLMAVRLWNMMIETIQRRGVVHSLMDDLRTQWDCDRAVLRGLPVDEAYVRWLDRKLRSVVDEAAEHLARLGIKPSGSGPQVGEAFARLGVQSPKQSPKTGKPSWDKEVLKALAKRGPGDPGGWLAQRIIEVRQATKFHAAYVQPMLDALELDGHVHCDLRALGTVTGRMSAARPAIQQLPKKDTRVRAAYGGRLGWVFVSCDLAQGEPRTMAALSGDPNLIADIEAGDINNAVTAAAFGHAFDPSEGKVAGTPSYLMRQGGKAGFLAKVYGAGIGRLATTIGTDDPATRAINDRWEQRYSVMFERFARLNQGVKITLANGFEVPLWDRYTVDDETGELLVYPKPSRKAGNYETQGTQKLYLNQAWRRMVARGWSWALAMFVHDEILLLVPEFMAEAARRDLEECMTFDIGNGVTMLCEATIDGPTWLPQPSDFDLRELEAVEI
ncbi:MAG TPA: DNA polymerase [Pseudonocardiaceae bacterium]|nr:DNA polymerase [Pseudonocardiaceae bacterium]